jgi:hypothetical protein
MQRGRSVPLRGGTFKRSLWVVILSAAKNPLLLPFAFLLLLSKNAQKHFWKNEPNFFTTKYALSNQNRRNGGQKTTQKNETNPFVDNFACPLPTCKKELDFLGNSATLGIWS